MNEIPPGNRDPRSRNRVILAWIVAGCVVMGTLGFLFALWLRGRPSGQ